MSSSSSFDRLVPFIKDYIYRQRWEHLREAQVEACRVLFDSDDHLLLASGTASGKTEATFFPILTKLVEDPPGSVGVLYIGPIKALINDQFLRLNDLLKEADLPVWHWHGDVSQGHKQKLLKNPRGVLQITPESLESLLINRTTDLMKLFGDLRFIVIDEVHAFLDSDRGRQVQCQVQRLERFMRTQPRRVGLSATLGDYSVAERWLAAKTGRAVQTPEIRGGNRKVRLALEHFIKQEDQKGEVGIQASDLYLFESSKNLKCIIFANSRGDTEKVVANLRHIAEQQHMPDRYHVHHGSIAAPLRQAAEDAMREPDSPAVIAATLTLELGIDVGQLERVIQLEAPFSVASFVQRLGRTGRRDAPAEMWFVSEEEEPSAKDLLPEQIPWGLIQSIAIIQLYLEEKWIEPASAARYPFSLLYHQTMSTLASMGELSPAALAQRVMNLPPFQNVTGDDYKTLLYHLLEKDHIQRTEGGGLIVGLTGERVVRSFRFYAVFPDNEEYSVREEARQIGSIMNPPPPGERFALAGRTWEVLDIDQQAKSVYVQSVKGKASIHFNGSGGSIHTKILERMRQVLFEDTDYKYLQAGARTRLEQARKTARLACLDTQHVISLGGNMVCIFPWIGSKGITTLVRYLRVACKDTLGQVSIEDASPYYLVLKLNQRNMDDVHKALRELERNEVNPEQLLMTSEVLAHEKFDEFIPDELLRKSFACDELDVDELRRAVKNWPDL